MEETALTASTASLATVRALDLPEMTAKRVSTQVHSNPREFDIPKQTKLNPGKLNPPKLNKFNSQHTDQIPGMKKMIIIILKA